MMKTQIGYHTPSNQTDYQMGLMDGTRYRADGHLELMDRYNSGSRDYRMGFDDSAAMPRAMDPDYAS